MANIFAGDGPPAWLQRRAETGYESALKSSGGLGEIIGTGLAAGVKWATHDKSEVDPMTGKIGGLSFGQAWQEARLNQANPLWALDAEQKRMTWLSAAANVAARTAMLKQAADENDALRKDAPLAGPYFSATPEQRATMPTPTFTSHGALGILQKIRIADEQHFWRKQQAEHNSLLAKAALKDQRDFAKRLLSLDPEERAQVRSVSPNKDGTPSAMQWRALKLAEERIRTAKQNTATQTPPERQ
jgi:hypothetical protein